MVIGGLVAGFFGVDAEQKLLEDIAKPLSATHPSPHLSAVTGAPRSGGAEHAGLTWSGAGHCGRVRSGDGASVGFPHPLDISLRAASHPASLGAAKNF